MNSIQMRPLFRAEVDRLSSQLRVLLQSARQGDTVDARLQALEGAHRRWLALKSAAVVVEADWLERVSDVAGQRIKRAIDGGPGLGDDEWQVLADALQLADAAAVAPDEAWDDAHAQARGKCRTVLAALGVKRMPAPAAPAAPTPSMPAAKPANPDAKTARMHELLKQEATEQTATMQRLLLDLDAQPDQTQLIDPLLRAAHSLKGAARAAQLTPAVRLAHEFESRLLALQRQEIHVAPARTDLYLRVVDRLLALASREELLGQDLPDQATEDLIAQLEQDDASTPQDDIEPTALPPASGVSPPSARPASASSPLPSEAASSATLKVSAQAVNAMLGMAAQQLVEVDQMRRMAVDAHGLRTDAKLLHDDLEQLYRQLDGAGMPDEVATRMANLRNRLKQNRLRLSKHGEHLQGVIGQQELLVQRLYRTAANVRLRPLRDGLIAAPRMVRDLARQLQKNVRFIISGDELTLDRDILERLEAPLTHLLRNALDHGLESASQRLAAGKPEQGTVHLKARHHTGMLLIELSDDGRGIDPERIRERLRTQRMADGMTAAAVDAMQTDELFERLFVPGFSLAERVTELSGRGVGLDVVRTNLQEIDGSVRVTSALGQGTTFHLLVPTSRVVVRTVVVDVCGERYGFPLARVSRLVRIPGEAMNGSSQQYHVHVDGVNLRLFGLGSLLELGQNPGACGDLTAVVVDLQGKACGFVVHGVFGEFDLSVRPLDARLGRVSDVSAAAVMPDGEPVVLLDVDDLMRSSQRQRSGAELDMPSAVPSTAIKRVLVTDDSISVRELERQLLLGAGYVVDVAVDGMDAWNKVRENSYDLLVTDVDMPRMDGIELTRSVKQDAALRRMPVMIVSYRDKPEDRARGLEARADCYVTKSDFQGQRFLSLVEDLLASHGGPSSRGSHVRH